MNLDDWVEATEREGHRLGEVAAGTLDADVGACPGWSMSDLVAHTGMVHRLALHAVSTGSPPTERAMPPEGENVLDWYRQGLGDLLNLFSSADPKAEAWNWSGVDLVAGWWWRRMAQETAIHRWDGEDAVGDSGPIDPILAADGIDEWLDVHVRRKVNSGDLVGDESTGSVHIHCGDVEGEWWADLNGSELALERVHRKGDVVFRGGASDLLLVMWGRIPMSSVEILGEADLAAAWTN